MRGKEPVIRKDGAVEIPLTRGQAAVVSSESYEAVSGVLWVAQWSRCTSGYYARGANSGALMHRVILSATRCRDVDHVNHDGLDNRVTNLRLVTKSENGRNSRSRSGSSRFKGVSWYKANRKWGCHITIPDPAGARGRLMFLGLFIDEEEAARVYDNAARELFGEHAFTNEDAGLLEKRCDP
jgi:hypothetical protein